MADIKKILAKVVGYEQEIKSGKKSKTIKVGDAQKDIKVIYVPSVTI